MLALKIDNPEIEVPFKIKFNGNKEKFINFIQLSLENLDDSKNDEFQFKKLDPKQNSYFIVAANQTDNLSNPFETIENVLEFSKSLREKAYR